MRNRWKVERRHAAWPEPHFRWEVIEKIDGLEDFHGPFDSHPEAMTYADRMARTIQATLGRPRNCTKIPLPEGHENQAPIWVNSSGRDATISYAAGRNHGSIYVRHGELEPLALTLLSLSRKDTTHDH